MSQEKIDFNVYRDFSDLFNISIKFLFKNFKHFFRIITFIAGPFILMTCIMGSFYQLHSLQRMSLGKQYPINTMNYLMNMFSWEYFVFIFFSICSGLVLITTVYSYMISYTNYGPKNFGLAEVKAGVLQNIGKVILAFFLYLLIFMGIALILTLLVSLIVALLKSSIVAMIFFVILIVIGLILIIPPYYWQFSVCYLILMKDQTSIIEALKKAGDMRKGEFFSTWLLVIASGLTMGIVSMLFSIPLLIYQTIAQLNHMSMTGKEIPYILLSCLSLLVSVLLSSFLFVIYGLHYFSLSEKKEGNALIDRINEIGNTPSGDVDQEY